MGYIRLCLASAHLPRWCLIPCRGLGDAPGLKPASLLASGERNKEMHFRGAWGRMARGTSKAWRDPERKEAELSCPSK